MTVSTTPRFQQYVGDNVTTQFAVPFQFFEIEVYVNGVLKAPGVDYTIVGGNGSTGTITFSVAPPAGQFVAIVGATVVQQQTEYRNFDDAPAELFERSLDRDVMMIAENLERLKRCPRAAVHNPPVPELDFQNNPNRVMATDGTGNLILAVLAELDLFTTDDFVPPARNVNSGAGLTGGGNLSADRTLAVGQGVGIVVNADDVAIDKATDANIRAAVADKVVTADRIESASAGVALVDAAPVAVDWDAAINFTLTVTANRAIGNPTNGQPGTWRTILVQGNDATDRTITFGNQFLGELPTITDCDNGRWYQLMIYCVTATHFVVSAKRANG